ncbi:MAG: (2Fe-2S) ferredoxin domain-containing protein [Candidatus Margulisiibacteriota bacterium]
MNPLERLLRLQDLAKGRVAEKKINYSVRIYCGSATCENAAGAIEVYKAIEKIKEEKKLDYLYLGKTGCSGRCDKEPIVQVIMDSGIPTKYCEMTPEKIARVIDEHIIGNNVMTEWAL